MNSYTHNIALERVFVLEEEQLYVIFLFWRFLIAVFVTIRHGQLSGGARLPVLPNLLAPVPASFRTESSGHDHAETVPLYVSHISKTNYFTEAMA